MAENGKQEESKIFVDTDWKKQAQEEKEKLAKEVEEQSTSGGAAEAAAGAQAQQGGAEQRELPEANFTTLVSSLVTQIYFALGGMEDPRTKKRYLDPELAKHHIDTLAMLDEKTKGNLADEERKLLEQALYETRMQYVQVSQAIAQQMQQAQQGGGETPEA